MHPDCMPLCPLLYITRWWSGPACVMWRQTKGCDPEGWHEPRNDKKCDERIPDDASGYCECRHERWRMFKGCQKGKYRTCKQACDDKKG